MNDVYSNMGGWETSKIRNYVNDDIYNSLPIELKKLIVDTKVVSGHGSEDSSNFVTTDKLYLLATAEVYENGIQNDTARDLTRQLEYYSNLGVTASNNSGALKKLNGSNASWWLRSAYSYSTYDFRYVSSTGRLNNSRATNADGVAVAFRIG